MANEIILKVERISFTYVTLQDAAEFALEIAKNAEEGRFYNCLSAMLYSAFCLEAYLNHIGIFEIENWNKVERNISPGMKLDLLVKKKGYEPDFSKRPFKTFNIIFEFRKKIVHGKTERLKTEENKEGEIGDGDTPEIPMTSWEESITLEMATSFVKDTALMISELHPIFGFKENPFFTQWKSSWEKKPYEGNS
jgi:hypothetical protein